MPFQSIFFELERNYAYKYIGKENDWGGIPIGGLTVSTTNPFFKNPLQFTAFSAKGGGDVAGLSYLDNGNILISEAFPRILVDGQIFTKSYAYLYDPRNKLFAQVLPGSTQERPLLSRIEMELPDDDCLNAIKLANLGINAIQYINAQNITYHEMRRRDRKTVVQNIWEGNNMRRRLKKTKRRVIETELKPYYWIEIKKESRRVERGEGDSTLNCRFWVRGHNRFYCDSEGNEKYHRWIEPYVKGPKEAPFKENRYEVLYKRFRPLLENPLLRQGPWSMSELNSELNKCKNKK